MTCIGGTGHWGRDGQAHGAGRRTGIEGRFAALDRDGDGTVTLDEFKAAFERCCGNGDDEDGEGRGIPDRARGTATDRPAASQACFVFIAWRVTTSGAASGATPSASIPYRLGCAENAPDSGTAKAATAGKTAPAAADGSRLARTTFEFRVNYRG